MAESNKTRTIFSSKIMIIIASVVLVIVVGILFYIQNNSNTKTDNSNTTIAKATMVPCSVDTTKYADKILLLAADDFKGEIRITVNSEKCRMEVQYVMIMKANLPDNHVEILPYLYNYLGYLDKENETVRSNSNGTGIINPAYVNKGVLPDDISTYGFAAFYAPNGLSNGTTKTDYFYARFERWQPLSEEGFNNLLLLNKFSIINAAPYMEKDSATNTFSINTEKANLNGEIVRTYKFTVNEK